MSKLARLQGCITFIELGMLWPALKLRAALSTFCDKFQPPFLLLLPVGMDYVMELKSVCLANLLSA
eukprot:c39979_g1_i1 orf=70-267(+)